MIAMTKVMNELEVEDYYAPISKVLGEPETPLNLAGQPEHGPLREPKNMKKFLRNVGIGAAGAAGAGAGTGAALKRKEIGKGLKGLKKKISSKLKRK